MSQPPDNPPAGFAADGFPIDPALQKTTRRVAVGYLLLAAYYAAVLPFVLRFVRWWPLNHLTQDFLARGEILVTVIAYIAANCIFAACAWHVLAFHRWVSWSVVGIATAYTAWMCGSLGLALWRTVAMSPRPSFLHISLDVLLIAGYALCLFILWRAVSRFNHYRSQALAEAEGRVGV